MPGYPDLREREISKIIGRAIEVTMWPVRVEVVSYMATLSLYGEMLDNLTTRVEEREKCEGSSVDLTNFDFSHSFQLLNFKNWKSYAKHIWSPLQLTKIIINLQKGRSLISRYPKLLTPESDTTSISLPSSEATRFGIKLYPIRVRIKVKRYQKFVIFLFIVVQYLQMFVSGNLHEGQVPRKLLPGLQLHIVYSSHS